jgi:hypothetical protein
MTIMAITVTQSQQASEAVSLKPRTSMLYQRAMILVLLILLVLGILLTTAGIALLTSDLGLIFLLVGAILLVSSFAASRQLSVFLYLPEESTALALYVAVEFLAGACLAFLGVSNFLFESGARDWSLAAIAVFGLLLVTDSLLLYRRGFRQDLGKEKGGPRSDINPH